jgi:hypothetical protein
VPSNGQQPPQASSKHAVTCIISLTVQQYKLQQYSDTSRSIGATADEQQTCHHQHHNPDSTAVQQRAVRDSPMGSGRASSRQAVTSNLSLAVHSSAAVNGSTCSTQWCDTSSISTWAQEKYLVTLCLAGIAMQQPCWWLSMLESVSRLHLYNFSYCTQVVSTIAGCCCSPSVTHPPDGLHTVRSNAPQLACPC